jgi:NAD(P)-dependent dehydrogenase (short-subunit alcohol dehydrogenase family)
MVGGLPLPRAAQPSEAARAYTYLMTNAYVTGQVLPIDGGGMLV